MSIYRFDVQNTLTLRTRMGEKTFPTTLPSLAKLFFEIKQCDVNDWNTLQDKIQEALLARLCIILITCFTHVIE